VLGNQVVNWRLAAEIREFCVAVQAQSKDEAQEWLAWALKRADEIDPLLQKLTMPDIPEPELGALQPHQRRWNS